MSENLADILQKNKQKILDCWEKNVREKLSHARRENQITLIDSVPDFLDELVHALRTNLNVVKSNILRFSHKHGSERFHETFYSIEDALCEYNILRKVLFTILEEETIISNDERDIILEAINIGMMKAGSEYAKHQMIAIKSERAMLATIIEQMPAAVWIADATSGEITLSNSLGKDEQYFKAFHQSSHLLARSMLSETPCKNEIIKIQNKDNVNEFIRLDAAPIVNNQHQVTHGVAIGTDVTELLSTQEELRILFEMSGTGKVVINAHTKEITRANQAICTLLKFDDKELISKKLSELSSESEHEHQRLFKCKDGSTFWGEIFMSPLLKNNKGTELCICTIIDITDRKQAEDNMYSSNERLQMITDIQPTLIAQIDRDFRYEFVNKTYGEWYHMDLKAIIGTKISDIIAPEEFAKVLPYLNEALTGKRVVYEKEITFPQGKTRYLHITYSPNYNRHHEVVGLFVSVADHTEQRRILEEQKEISNSLHIEQKMRDKFISALSHDLRTPLTTATIATQMIERKADDSKIASLAQRASTSLNRVAKMIEDLLDANSFHAGHKFIPHLQEMNVVDLAINTLNELETIHGERFILDAVDVINTHLSPNGIRRVIENLCSNAIKYGSPTAPVTLGLYKEDQNLCLTVHNYGVPLKARESQTLFEQFVRSSSAEKSGKGGWGIGLSVVKAVVEAHGGTVDIESDETGTKFKILMPLDARAYVKQNQNEATGKDDPTIELH